MRAKAKPQLNNSRALVGKLDSGRSDVATRYKEVFREAAAAKHGRQRLRPLKR